MSVIEIKNCPGSLASGNTTYTRNVFKHLFSGKKVSHLLPYNSPTSNETMGELFGQNHVRISISGVQEKFSVLQEKNKLRLIQAGEKGQFILKPIPNAGKNSDQMPANEHLTMQLAKQVFGIETAENTLVFFRDGSPAYLTKRFDVRDDGSKWAQEDFASLAGRTPYTHGENYKYLGNYFELFEWMKKYAPAYSIEAPKLFKLIVFNYLFSNGDAHFKNFSLLETKLGDYRLSPAYDLLNSRIHINDGDFALTEGLLPKNHSTGKIHEQFYRLGKMANIPAQQVDQIMNTYTSKQEEVKQLICRSFLSERIKRNYQQAYLTRNAKLKRL